MRVILDRPAVSTMPLLAGDRSQDEWTEFWYHMLTPGVHCMQVDITGKPAAEDVAKQIVDIIQRLEACVKQSFRVSTAALCCMVVMEPALLS